MNENSSTNSSTAAAHHGLTAEAVSRRAYELWEQEGRPENRDLHHWLRAEQELLAEQAKKSNPPAGQSSAATAQRNVDLPQNQSMRGATPRNPPRSGPSARSTQPGMRTEPMRPPTRS